MLLLLFNDGGALGIAFPVSKPALWCFPCLRNVLWPVPLLPQAGRVPRAAAAGAMVRHEIGQHLLCTVLYNKLLYSVDNSFVWYLAATGIWNSHSS